MLPGHRLLTEKKKSFYLIYALIDLEIVQLILRQDNGTLSDL